MNILITNDDGLYAEGLRVLAEVAQQFGDVKVIAPDRERSACGHAMTMRDPLRMRRIEHLPFEGYELNGLPVDCVNVGNTILFPEGCDLILSGINEGPNLGFDITYSGTVAGAMEGAINDIRSIALSMALFVTGAPLHLDTARRWLAENFALLCELPVEAGTFLNVNIPSIQYDELRGMRVCQMGKRVYKDRVEERNDPWGRPYYWQGGVVVMNPSEQPGTDVEAVSEGFVSITPVSLDWTSYDAITKLRAAMPTHSGHSGIL
ncbi:MAG: 5'/3'-nucleotidase SurE [Armatimonadetes bacterium]|nr:5'/3'-nucleotidase SurE [Armatimonadota bacterium]